MRIVVWLVAFSWPLAALRDFDADLEGEISAILEPKEPARDAPSGSNVSAAREGTAGSAASPPEVAPPSGDDPGFFDRILRDVTIHPGRVGVDLAESGYVKEVAVGSQADGLGIRKGDQFVRLNGNPFKLGNLGRFSSGNAPYAMTVASPSMMATIILKTSWYLEAPAGLMGGLLLLGMIPAYRSHQRMGCDWQDDSLARCLACPAAVFSVGSLVCAKVLRVFFVSGVVYLGSDLAVVLYCVGLQHCLVSMLASPLLAAGLPETAIPRWRAENKIMWLVATVNVLLVFVKMATHYFYYFENGQGGLGFQYAKLLEYAFHKLPQVMLDMLLLEVASLIARILGAVANRTQQLQNALSCKAADFQEQAHAPCAELVNDTGPQLAPLGFPLLYFSMRVLTNGADVYMAAVQWVRSPVVYRKLWDYHVSTASRALEMVAVAFVIVVAPIRLSSAMNHLLERLNERRCSSHELHTNIQAVESMLKQANYGKGWGIQIREGVVLNRDFLQALCIRAALVMTAAIAFLDTTLGLEKAMGKERAEISNIQLKENTTEAEIAIIQHLLANLTVYIHNRT